MTASMQLELFEPEKVDQYAHLYDHWKNDLIEWPREIFHYRHQRYTTGWSMASSGYMYARMLYRCGKITLIDLRRYWKFNRRVTRWNINDKIQ
jgi:hypothetical protein